METCTMWPFNFGPPQWLSGKEATCKAGHTGDVGSIPGSRRSPGEGHGNLLQYSCLGKSHGQRSLEGYGPYGCKELDTPEVTEHKHISCIDTLAWKKERKIVLRKTGMRTFRFCSLSNIKKYHIAVLILVINLYIFIRLFLDLSLFLESELWIGVHGG